MRKEAVAAFLALALAAPLAPHAVGQGGGGYVATASPPAVYAADAMHAVALHVMRSDGSIDASVHVAVCGTFTSYSDIPQSDSGLSCIVQGVPVNSNGDTTVNVARGTTGFAGIYAEHQLAGALIFQTHVHFTLNPSRPITGNDVQATAVTN